MDPFALFLAAICVVSLVVLIVSLELAERRDVRRDREHREWLEDYGRRARDRVHELCQLRVPARRP